MKNMSYKDFLLGLSSRLSRNMPFALGEDNQLSDDSLFNTCYKNFANEKLKTFEEVSTNPFFNLLINNLKEAFENLPGWTGWFILEYYDESTNGLNLVVLVDKKENLENVDFSKLTQSNHNFSTLMRANRELHVHLFSWNFGEVLRSSDEKYIPLNKLSLAKLLPENENPYNKAKNIDYYKISIKPIILSNSESLEDVTYCRIFPKINEGFDFYDDLGEYFKLHEKINENAKAYTESLKDSKGNSLTDMIDKEYSDLSKINGKTEKDLVHDISEKLERSINNLVIDNGDKIELSKNAFSKYCSRLIGFDSDSKSFVYLPVFTNIKKGKKEAQRKDIQLGSVTIGSSMPCVFTVDVIQALWRFVQVELLKWYAQYSSFDLYSVNKQLMKEAKLNALTQVFARNESHINGSHVIPYLLKSNIVANDNSRDIYLKYLKERMELVGSVQNYPGLVKTTTNLDALGKSLKVNKLLWNGVVEGKCKFNIDTDLIIESKSRKIKFDLPGAVLGEQVLCSILEGIIRNFVKHNISHNDFELKIHLSVEELSCNDKQKDNYLSLTIYGNIEESQETVEIINNAIDKSVLEGINLRGNNLGLLEMKAASLLLMDAPLEAIDIFKTKKSVHLYEKIYPGSIKACLFEKESKSYLGYKLYLLLPKRIYTLNKNYNDVKDKEGFSKYIVHTEKINSGIASDFFIGSDKNAKSYNFRQIEDPGEECNNLSDLWRVWVKKKFSDSMMEHMVILNTPDDFRADTHKIIIDDHGIWLRENPGYDFSKLSFYVALNSNQNYGILRRQNQRLIFSVDPNSFIEAALTKVAILDERIQQWASEAVHQNTTMNMMKAFRYMNIYLPDIQKLDLNIPQKGKLVEKIKSYFKDGCRYVVLHHSIFERLCLDINGSKEANVVDAFYQTLHKPEKGEFLVLVSGLGIPTNLPHNAFYCSLSSLEKVLKDKPNKYFLVQFLYNLRITKN